MKIDREELLSILKMVAPAVASNKNQLPELSNIWFSGTHVSAFNDILGVQVELKTDFSGGVLGSKMIGVLEKSSAKVIDISLSGDDLLLKIGAANIKLTRRPIEDWFWEPELPEVEGYTVTQRLRDAVELMLVSVGSSNVLNAEQRGVTVVQKDGLYDLYSTDAATMSWLPIDDDTRLIHQSDRIIIPTLFCEQFIATKGDTELRFDENGVYCSTSIVCGDVAHDSLIFSKLVDDDNPVPFEHVVSDSVGKGPAFKIPEKLKDCADRAMVLLETEPAELVVENNYLLLYAQTSYGEIDDALKITEGEPSAISVQIDMSLLRRVLDVCDYMSVLQHALVLTGPGKFVHIIATK